MRLVLSLVLVLVPATVLAQPSSSKSSSDPGQMRDSDCARQRKLGKPCTLNMEAEVIEEGGIKPEGTIVDARIFPKHNSLIRIRKDFIAEILKSANDVD